MKSSVLNQARHDRMCERPRPDPFFKPSAGPAGSRIGESQRREEGAPSFAEGETARSVRVRTKA